MVEQDEGSTRLREGNVQKKKKRTVKNRVSGVGEKDLAGQIHSGLVAGEEKLRSGGAWRIALKAIRASKLFTPIRNFKTGGLAEQPAEKGVYSWPQTDKIKERKETGYLARRGAHAMSRLQVEKTK